MWEYVVGGIAMFVLIILWELTKEGIARIKAKTKKIELQNTPERSQIDQMGNMLDLIKRIKEDG
jgi:hypothetical protein